MKSVLRQLGRFRKDALACVGLTTLEVITDILLPFITAIIIDQGLERGDLPTVYRYGALMVVMAFLGLIFGAMAGKCRPTAWTTSIGFSAGSRQVTVSSMATVSPSVRSSAH